MDSLRKFNMKQGTVALAMASVFLVIFVLTALTPYLVDDYAYMFSFADGSRIASLGDIARSMVRHSQIINGRVISHGMEQLLLMLPKTVFNLCNALVFLWIVLFCYRIANVDRKPNAILVLAFPMCYWLFTPAFGQSTLWQVGSINYLWSVGFCLLFIHPYLSLYLESGEHFWNPVKCWETKILFFLLAFPFGMYGEIASIVGILMAIGFLFVRGIESKKWKSWLWLPIAAAIAGYVLLLFMPAEQMNKAGSLNLHDIIARVPALTRKLALFKPLCVTWVIMLFFSLATGGSHKRRIISLAFFLGGIAGIYVMLAASTVPERCLCCSSAFFCIACIVLFRELLGTRVGDACRATFCALAVLFSIQFVLGVFDIQAVHSRAVARDRSAMEQIAEGKSEIVLDIIYGATEYSGVKHLKDLDLDDPASWPNAAMAKYYGVSLVIGNDPHTELNSTY